jgi:hypothetical protein
VVHDVDTAPPVAVTVAPPVAAALDPPVADVPPVFVRVPPLLTPEEPPVATAPPVAVEAAVVPPVVRAPPVCTTGEPPVAEVTAWLLPPVFARVALEPPVWATVDPPPDALLVCEAPPVGFSCCNDELPLPLPPTPPLVLPDPVAPQLGITNTPNVIPIRIHGFVIEECISNLTSTCEPPTLGGWAKPAWCCITGWQQSTLAQQDSCGKLHGNNVAGRVE